MGRRSEKEHKKVARNIRLLLEYDGFTYHGWQIQPQSPTVQGVLQDALERLTGEKTRLKASGRTDAGVHAIGQVANFRTRSALAAEVFPRALNSLSPTSISVLAAQDVDDGFDSQYSASSKTYRYRLLLRHAPSALESERCWHIPFRINAARMRRAARSLTGTRDFSSFRAAGCAARDPVRCLHRAAITRRSENLFIDLEANGFLRHMVRAIVGTLVDVGRGRIPPERMPGILESRDRSNAGATAPAHGLYLLSVQYPHPYRWPHEQDP